MSILKIIKIMRYIFILLICIFFINIKTTYAVMAPDFLITISSSVLQIFSIVFIAISAFFGIFYKYLKSKIVILRNKRIVWNTILAISFLVFLIFFFAIVSYGVTFYYYEEHKKQYLEWSSANSQNKIFLNEEENKVVDIGIHQKILGRIRDEEIKKELIKKEELEVLIEDNEKKRLEFFLENKHVSVELRNSEFSEIINSDRDDYIIIDAREDIEYEIGRMLGAIHIRFADIKAGRWQELDPEKFVYTFCWSGMRGEEVVEFLRSKNIVAAHLKNGAKGWYDFGGAWEGDIRFLDKYTAERYKYLFKTDELKVVLEEGAILVDSRDSESFKEWHHPGSVNISTMVTPTASIDRIYFQIATSSSVVIMCDNYVNCFDAKLTAVELERRGYNFLGRFNKPWELK